MRSWPIERYRSSAQAHVQSLGMLALVALFFSGCGRSDGKVERVTLSGTVTYKGKSVTTGMISFTPDFSKGNRGPQGIAKIVNGHYSTDTGQGKGSVVGPQRVEIRAYEGSDAVSEGDTFGRGRILFPPYQTTVDVPEQGGTLNFEVPE